MITDLRPMSLFSARNTDISMQMLYNSLFLLQL